MCATHSFWLKLDRAYEHLKLFEREAEAWVEDQSKRVVDEPDPDPAPYHVFESDAIRKRIRVTGVDEVPMRFSILIGDCVFNLRSALDHLALALGLAHTPGMSAKQIKGSEFPVFNRPMTQGDETKMIGCLHPAAAAAIKGMQPYLRGSNYATDPIWQIHELNIIDKHRALTTVSGILLATDPDGVSEPAIGFMKRGDENISRILYTQSITANFHPLKVDAVLFRYAGVPIDQRQDVQMHPTLPIQIAFGNERARRRLSPSSQR
jgi:hypothetical protein